MLFTPSNNTRLLAGKTVGEKNGTLVFNENPLEKKNPRIIFYSAQVSKAFSKKPNLKQPAAVSQHFIFFITYESTIKA